eukprot:12697654-Alexandrium_andersonii.AAC.1
MFSQIPNLEVGQPVAPVRELGPQMIAPRLEDSKGSFQRSVDVQHHPMKALIDENDRSLWADGVPRIGSFNWRSYPSMD